VHAFARDNLDPEAESPEKRSFRRNWNVITDAADEEESDANGDANVDDNG
jgi:hypothetical protein